MIKQRHWYEDLLGWGLSQCYYYFKITRKDGTETYCCIYLRWRYSDPWVADILHSQDLKELLYASNHSIVWKKLNISYWKDNQLRAAEKEAVRLAKEWVKLNLE